MSKLDFHKQAQKYYESAPVIILGSGASIPFGMSSMQALSTHLINSVRPPENEINVWSGFSQLLEEGIDLETALHKTSFSDDLLKLVVDNTWKLINPQDIEAFNKSIGMRDYFPLKRLISSMLHTAHKEIDIITTNYDRLVEYACEKAGYRHYTGFSYGYVRHLIDKDQLQSDRTVNIWKVHGSLDWFKDKNGDTYGLGHTEHIPEFSLSQIVTPGIEKYKKTHLEPYRTIISQADKAIKKSSSYLCCGFGFNDEHIQEKLVEKCVRGDSIITVVTRDFTDAAKEFLFDKKVKSYLAIERGDSDGQSVIYSSQTTEKIIVDEDYWTLSGYLNLVL
ncbi:SIR2 family protein [Piscirickettsia salmonis]|uniref:SIR2 family protein n=1 Tax=Piscirickettsia salmonis TaxID=1238 RepID=UPI0006BDF14B|nr:SIR2 family protein [Piscirickettsia salmonis]ALA26696.1 hypothetical protein KW89_3p70 [Piscirickettsia salmonis]QGO82311.1 hypothetical protein Psal107_03362 [Piscirickettsia salmonis]QGP24140.1 hypothetical protein Psal158_03314 [Piscirickettsia salmonis]QGP27566.1 hypothetical protein Psal159_03359 [Piscirickettsia salmonis]QGP30912.1 hypothetical protein Psal160_03322 [Piscirickettsia salmonis]